MTPASKKKNQTKSTDEVAPVMDKQLLQSPPLKESVPIIHELIHHAKVVVCTGSGGVGKTTTAAALAIQGALAGRRTVVITIDPAKRLADALGIASLSNTPSQINGDWSGELWAMMLDPKATFDELVIKTALKPEQATAILQNRFYKNISEALSGTQEYMATEKLFELATNEQFDLIIIDTPPTRNALDFLEAPKRLVRFLDHKLYRLLTSPTRGFVKAASFAAQTFLRTISKIIGTEPIQDALTFFTAFDGMDEGFKQRASNVEQLLHAETTHYVVITAPRVDALDEASYFIRKLLQTTITPACVIVNRVHPDFGMHLLGQKPLDALDEIVSKNSSESLTPALENAIHFLSVHKNERKQIQEFSDTMDNPPLVTVQLKPHDIHTIEDLLMLGTELVQANFT